MNLAEITLKIDELNEKRKAEERSHKSLIASIDAEIKQLQINRNTVSVGLDLDKVNLAKCVVYVRGSYSQRQIKRVNAVNAAISDIASGCNKLKREFFGVKNYEAFGDQESDHPYGYGPRHGSIVFTVGLAVRDRDLTPEEIDAAIYLLLNIEQVQKSEQVAA